MEIERSALLFPDEGGSQSLEASSFLAASHQCRRTVVKPVFPFLTCWALTHRPLWLSLGSLCGAGAAGLLPDSLGQGPPEADWAAELSVLNGGWLSLGAGVVERAWEGGPAPVLALLLITYHQPR